MDRLEVSALRAGGGRRGPDTAPCRRRLASRLVARWVVLAALTSGCAQGSDRDPASGTVSGPPTGTAVGVGPDLSASLVQYRDDVFRRVLSVQVMSNAPLEVHQVQLEMTAFQALGPADGASLRPGLPVDLRVSYGAVRCEGDPAAGATAVLAVGPPGGPVRQARLALPEAPTLLGRLHAAECAEQEVRRQVELTLEGFTAVPGQDAMAGTLRIRRLAGTARVRVPELGRSTLLTLTGGPPGGPVLTLEAGEAQAQVAVQARATRCDPHALAESKRSTAFRVFVAVDEAEPLLVIVEPPPTDRDALVRFVTDSCRARS